MPRKHMRTVGIGDVMIAVAAILFVAAYVLVRGYERRVNSLQGLGSDERAIAGVATPPSSQRLAVLTLTASKRFLSFSNRDR
jgi:hypothetical protein